MIDLTETSPYRTILCEDEKDLVTAGRIRYVSYRHVNAIASNDAGLFLDDYDLKENSRTCILSLNDTPVGSIRAGLYSPGLGFSAIPSMEVYKKEIEENIDLDKTVIESNRFVTLPEAHNANHIFKELFRFIFLNAFKAEADYVLTAVRQEHARFYSRLMMYPISAPKKYPGINVDMVLLLADCSRDLQSFISRNPEYGFDSGEIKKYPGWKSDLSMY